MQFKIYVKDLYRRHFGFVNYWRKAWVICGTYSVSSPTLLSVPFLFLKLGGQKISKREKALGRRLSHDVKLERYPAGKIMSVPNHSLPHGLFILLSIIQSDTYFIKFLSHYQQWIGLLNSRTTLHPELIEQTYVRYERTFISVNKRNKSGVTASQWEHSMTQQVVCIYRISYRIYLNK